MVWILFVCLFLALLLFVIAKNKKAQSTESGFSYKKTPLLFTPAERSFFGVLEQAVGKDFRLFGKVRVADVLAPIDGLNKSAWQTAFNKINRKHFDFVLCSTDDLSVLCAIEFDDKTHQQKNRQDRDEFLASACIAAGVPLISFQAKHSYSASEVSAKIAEVLSGISTTIPSRAEISPSNNALHQEPIVEHETEMVDTPVCPRCSSPMVKRTAKGGENAGKEFWGCSNFPKCREIVAI